MHWTQAPGAGFQSAPISHGWLKSQTARGHLGHVPDPQLLGPGADVHEVLNIKKLAIAFLRRNDARGPPEQCVLALGHR